MPKYNEDEAAVSNKLTQLRAGKAKAGPADRQRDRSVTEAFLRHNALLPMALHCWQLSSSLADSKLLSMQTARSCWLKPKTAQLFWNTFALPPLVCPFYLLFWWWRFRFSEGCFFCFLFWTSWIISLSLKLPYSEYNREMFLGKRRSGASKPKCPHYKPGASSVSGGAGEHPPSPQPQVSPRATRSTMDFHRVIWAQDCISTAEMDYLSLQSDLGDVFLSESSAAKTINKASSGKKQKQNNYTWLWRAASSFRLISKLYFCVYLSG